MFLQKSFCVKAIVLFFSSEDGHYSLLIFRQNLCFSDYLEWDHLVRPSSFNDKSNNITINVIVFKTAYDLLTW